MCGDGSKDATPIVGKEDKTLSPSLSSIVQIEKRSFKHIAQIKSNKKQIYMKKRILLMSTFCLALFSGASGQTLQDSVAEAPAEVKEVMLQELKPTYLKNISEAANWGRNWFIELKGGASAFLGSPLGCGDVFDRITPALQVGIGKWFTPAVGGRLAFQGMTFKNAEFQSMKYQFVHADFMYNLTAFIRQNDQGLSRWDVIPYVGVGMVHNSDWTSPSVGSSRTSGSHPFAFSYGIETRYRLTDRMHLIAELAGMTTAPILHSASMTTHHS